MKKNNSFPWLVTPLALAIGGFAAGNAEAAGLDTSFGVNGLASLNFQPGTFYPVSDPEVFQAPFKNTLLEQANGELVSFASRYEELGTYSPRHCYYQLTPFFGQCLSYYWVTTGGNIQQVNSKTRMARFNAGGTPLTQVTLDGIIVYAAREQADGKLVVAGNNFSRVSGAWSGVKPTQTIQTQVRRFNADGSVDATFDGDGIATIGAGGANRLVKDIVQLSDGKLLMLTGVACERKSTIGQSSLFKLNTDGSLDTSFGVSGEFVLGTATCRSEMIRTIDNNVLILSNAQIEKRLSSTAALDASFDGDGVLNPAGLTNTYAVRKSAGGKIIIGGNLDNKGLTMLRYNSDGSLDATFAIAGPEERWGFTDISQYTSTGHQLGLKQNGDVIIYNSDGTLNSLTDTLFSNGLTTDLLGQSTNRLLVSGVDNAGNAVLAGYTAFGDTDPDGDSWVMGADNCPTNRNADQADFDGDGFGDVCEPDRAGTVDLAFNTGSNVNGIIYATALQPDGKIIIGGAFTSIGGVPRSKIARLNVDGSLDISFDPGATINANSYNDRPWVVAVQKDKKIIVGGSFNIAGGSTSNRIVRLNADGSIDAAFNISGGANSDINALLLQPDGKILVGGSFSLINGVAINRVVRLNADGSPDVGFNPGTGPNDTVRVMALQPDGKILLGGSFTSVNGIARNRIARLNAGGSVDGTFAPVGASDGGVLALALQMNGQIMVGGSFSNFNGVPHINIARINEDGSLDGSFNASNMISIASVLALIAQPDGKTVVGRQYSWTSWSNGTTTVNHAVVRLNVDGSADGTINPGSGASNHVSDMLMQPDGKIIISGELTSFNGIANNYIARIHSGNSDGDFVEDAADKFPLNSTEWFDNDNDGIGNNVDMDDDNDGMPDVWEIANGFNPLVNDANGDADGDGFTNLQEYKAGTNPHDASSHIHASIKNDYINNKIAGWIWQGVSNGVETESQDWQLTFPLYSTNWAIPNRFYMPTFPDQANWDIVTTGDFNKDGDADILWRNKTTDDWKIWQMQNGTRVAQTSWTDNFDPTHAWQVIGAGDTDKDGDDDVILNNPSTGEILIWEMQNHAVLATHSVGTKVGYTLSRIGDFNKDGDVDLLLRQNSGDALITWEIENNAFVAERALANTGTSYNPVCAADFDGDGDDDILLVNSSTQVEKWFVMENFTRTQAFGSGNIGFTFQGCGDYDGDGDADTVWLRDADTMTRVVLQQNYGVNKQTVYTNPFGGANGFIYRGNSN